MTNKYWGMMNKNEQMKNEIDSIDQNGNYIYDPVMQYSFVRRDGNKIYFYDEVNQYTQFALIKLLNDAQQEIISKRGLEIVTGEFKEKIEIHINSLGGLLHSGFAIYDYIKNMLIPTVGIVEGSAMSAATLILLACDERQMSENSTILIHQLSSAMWGNYNQMCDEKTNMDKAMDKLRKIYLMETGIGVTEEMNRKVLELKDDPIAQEKLAESFDIDRLEELNNLLSHDLELNIDECKKLGLIDPDIVTPLSLELTEENQEKVQKFVEKLLTSQIKDKAKSVVTKNETPVKKEKKGTTKKVKK